MTLLLIEIIHPIDKSFAVLQVCTLFFAVFNRGIRKGVVSVQFFRTMESICEGRLEFQPLECLLLALALGSSSASKTAAESATVAFDYSCDVVPLCPSLLSSITSFSIALTLFILSRTNCHSNGVTRVVALAENFG